MSETIHTALAAVNREIDAIAKEHVNDHQRFNFRGIDDAYNSLHDLLAKHGIVTIPVVLSREQIERKSSSGGPLYFTFLDVEYHFVHEGGTELVARVAGEAMDSSDKGTNKALAAAHKYALFQTFTIPTLFSDPDAFAEPEPVPVSEPESEPVAMATAAEIKKLRKAVKDEKLKPEQVAYLEKHDYKVTAAVAARALESLEANNEDA